MLVLLLTACLSEPTPPAPEPTPEPPAAIEAEPLSLSAGPTASAPHLTPASDGLVLSWWEEDGEQAVLQAVRLTAEGASDPMLVGRFDDALINWADVPTVAHTPRGWLATWPGHAEGHAYDVMLAHSEDGGEWSVRGPAHDDATATEHGFASVVSGPEATHLFWLDGRATADGGPMALRVATVTAEALASEVVDPRVCDCCGTDAVLAAGGPVVAYRDRSDEEVRDIQVAHRTDAGWQSVTVADGWSLRGCPVNGPALDLRDEQLALAWYTEAGGPQVKLATGTPSALGEPVVIAGGESVLGRVDVAMTEVGPVVSWLEAEGEVGRVRARVGAAGSEIRVGQTTASRSAGFPVVGRLGDRLVWVWTVPGEGLKASTVALSML
ncbi:MAG: hypothetical protein EP330_31210 [Deltaproteobacteria bacterium]|nr:MAG: hypothetical protein EP330_31210 [Deltaproteobacteria bacterium]